VNPPSPTPNNKNNIKERTSPRNSEAAYNWDAKCDGHGNRESKV
jgi:hypothetical protein